MAGKVSTVGQRLGAHNQELNSLGARCQHSCDDTKASKALLLCVKLFSQALRRSVSVQGTVDSPFGGFDDEEVPQHSGINQQLTFQSGSELDFVQKTLVFGSKKFRLW